MANVGRDSGGMLNGGGRRVIGAAVGILVVLAVSNGCAAPTYREVVCRSGGQEVYRGKSLGPITKNAAGWMFDDETGATVLISPDKICADTLRWGTRP
jgi:hypothetical protein